MRICLIGDGRSIHLKRWALSLKSRGIVVSTYFTHDAPGFKDIPNHRFNYNKIYLLNSKWRNYKFSDFLQSIDADIYHIHFLIYNSLVKEFVKMKNLVITPYGSEVFWDLSSKQIRMKRQIIEKASLVTASSKFLLDKLIEQGYTFTNKKLIYFGIDRNSFKPLKKGKTSKFRIGFVKHLIDYYGIENLVKAVEIILKKRQDVELHIYGEGPLRQSLTDYIESHNLNQNIFLFGAKEHGQLPEIYNQFDVFAMPSTCQEAFGVAAIEAQACGIPVIASNTGGIPEAVQNGKSGILIEPGNIDKIVESLETLIYNETLRRQMSRNAVEWSKKFDWNKSVSAMIEAYKALLK